MPVIIVGKSCKEVRAIGGKYGGDHAAYAVPEKTHLKAASSYFSQKNIA